MNKLEELILREYDIKVGDTIQFTEVFGDKTRSAKLEIIEADNVVYCMDHNSKTSRLLTDMFNTMNEIRIRKVGQFSKTRKCGDHICSTCPAFTNQCVLITNNNETSVYESMKKIVDRFNEIEFVDE